MTSNTCIAKPWGGRAGEKRHGCWFFNWNADFWDSSLRLTSLKLLYGWTERKGNCLSENSCFLERVNLSDFNNYRMLVWKVFCFLTFSCFPVFILQYFTGNRDRNTVVTNSFVPILRCRYIRVHPRRWYKHISMRVEFYGCLTGILYNLEVKEIIF